MNPDKPLPALELKVPLTIPFYAKMSILFVGLFVFISMLSIAQDLILPLVYALIISISINPIIHYLVRKRINRTLAIAGVLLIALLLIATVIALIISQASLLIEALPRLTDKLEKLINQGVTWASGYLNISVRKINEWLTHTKNELLMNSNMGIGNTLATAGGVMTTVILTPVYIFMILYYQPHLIKFAHQLFGTSNGSKVSEIFAETKRIIQSYLGGLFTEFVIIAILNSLGLLFLDIDYAILLGIIGAFLNIIPYLGGLIGVVLFMAMALVTKSPEYVLYVIIMYIIIQFIDNNFIVPKIVGAKVKLNALVSIIAVFAGAALWGIPGMFLAIPVTAVIKLILDRIESLTPWGFLLGDTMPPIIQLDQPQRLIAKTKALVKHSSRSRG